MSNFDEAFEEVIGLEGGYVDDPTDKGGETKYGISKRSYPHLNIKALTLEQAKHVYWTDFWNPLLLAQMPSSKIATEIFEQAINFGKYWGVFHAQQALAFLGYALSLDGLMGGTTVSTISLAASRKQDDVFMKIMNGLQFKRYLEIVINDPSQKRFFVGWLKRVSL